MDPDLRTWAAAHARTVRARQGAAPELSSPIWAPDAPIHLAARKVASWSGHSGQITRVRWIELPGGQLRLSSAGYDSTARIWDAPSGQLLHSLEEHTASVYSASWTATPDGRLLVATTGSDGRLHIWDGHSGRLLETLARGSDSTYSAAWAVLPDGQLRLATSGSSSTATIWDGHTFSSLHTLTHDSTWVYSVDWAVLADGRLRLATACHDGIVRIWDGHTGRLLHSAADHGAPVIRVAWTALPDGGLRLASTGHDGTVRVWDGHSGSLLHTLWPHPEETLVEKHGSLAWAPLPDGRLLLATISHDRVIRIWDGRTGTELTTITDPGGPEGLALLLPSNGGPPLLAVGDHNGGIHVWELTVEPPISESRRSTGWQARFTSPDILVERVEEITPPELHAATDGMVIRSTACLETPDGRFLLAIGGNRGNPNIAAIFDGRSGSLLFPQITAHAGDVDAVALTLLDGRPILATGTDYGTVRIWDGTTGAHLHTLTGRTRSINMVTSVSWGRSPDGRLLLASVGEDGVHIWDGNTGRLERTIIAHGRVNRAELALLPDGRLLLAAAGDNGTISVWDALAGSLQGTYQSTNQEISWWAISCTVTSDSGLLVAVGGTDKNVYVWEVNSNKIIHTLSGHKDTVLGVAFVQLPGGPLLAASIGSNNDRTVRIWNINTGHLAAPPIQDVQSSWGGAVSWQFLSDGRLLLVAGGADSGARIWEVHLTPSPVATAHPEGKNNATAAVHPAVFSSLLSCGKADFWPPLGLLDDLVSLTGRSWSLNDGRLSVLADHPGIRLLRELHWPARARAALAALLASRLTVDAAYAPPEKATGEGLRAALTAALGAARSGSAPAEIDLVELRAAADEISSRTIALLTIIGPEAAGADPLLPLRLTRHMPQLPMLSGQSLRLLGDVTRAVRNEHRPGGGSVQHAPGTAGVGRHGQLTQLLPTQLALPRDLLVARRLRDQLLYRRHLAEIPPTPRPVTLILDTTPPTHGPAEQVLRLVAHLVTVTLWEYGEHPALISLTRPETMLPLTGRTELVQLWSTRTLDPPGPALNAALATARGAAQPVVLLAHHHTPHGIYLPGPGRSLLTTHHPPEPAPPAPGLPEHHHLPPNPTQARLARVVRALISPSGAS